jgi:uncharacterized protein (TIGR02118 family)
MTKVMVLDRKRSDMGADDFRRHLDEVHLPLVARLPGLRRLVANHVVASADGSTPPYDAVMEDWFESMEAMQAGFAGPEGQAVGADLPTFADPEQLRILVVQEVEMPLTAMAPGSAR